MSSSPLLPEQRRVFDPHLVWVVRACTHAPERPTRGRPMVNTTEMLTVFHSRLHLFISFPSNNILNPAVAFSPGRSSFHHLLFIRHLGHLGCLCSFWLECRDSDFAVCDWVAAPYTVRAILYIASTIPQPLLFLPLLAHHTRDLLSNTIIPPF